MKSILAWILSALTLFGVTRAGRAQSFAIDWYSIGGGGGTSGSGSFSLDGSIGQPDASDSMSAGAFSLTGGFWSVVAVQTAGAPLLKIFVSPTNTAIIAWPFPSAGFALQQKTDLNAALWVTPPESVRNDGTNTFIIVNPSAGNRFFRLSKP